MVDEAAYPSACTLNTHYRIVSYLVSLTLIVVFAARCYASAAYPVMRCLSVCCVCVSVTFVHSVKMNKYIFKIFSPPGSHAFLVLPTKRHAYILTRTHVTGASTAGGVGRNRDSEPIRLHCVLSTLRPAGCYQYVAARPRSCKL